MTPPYEDVVWKLHDKSQFEKGRVLQHALFVVLQFRDHRQDHGVALGGFVEVAGKIVLDGGLDGVPVPDALAVAAIQSFHHHFLQDHNR